PQRRVLNRVPALRLRSIFRIVDLAKQRRMDDRDVIALEIVVDVDLPVAGELPILARREFEAAVIARRHVGYEVAEKFGERHGVRIEIDENQLAPNRDLKSRQ